MEETPGKKSAAAGGEERRGGRRLMVAARHLIIAEGRAMRAGQRGAAQKWENL